MMGEFICRKCGKPATKIYLKDEHWQNECDECFGSEEMSSFEKRFGNLTVGQVLEMNEAQLEIERRANDLTN